jgi:MFS family permease
MQKRIPFLLSLSLFWPVLSILSDGVNTLFLPQRLLESRSADSQAALTGGLTFTGLVAGMLFQPIAGAWSDRIRPRWGRKGLLIPGTLVVLLSLLFLVASSHLPGIAVGYILLQLGLNTIQAAQQGLIPDQVTANDRGLASGIKNFMDVGGAMVGFVLLGQFLGKGKIVLSGWIMAGLTILALLLTFLWVKEPRLSQVDPSRSTEIFSSFKIDLRQHRSFVWLVTARFFFLLGTYAVGRFLLIFVAASLHLTEAEAPRLAGNLLAGLAFVTVITAPLAGRLADRFGRRPLMLFGTLISAGGVIGYIFASSLVQIILFGCMLSLGSAAFASANWAMTADVVPKDEAARFFALANIGTTGAAAAAGLFGFLVDPSSPSRGGFSWLFIAAAIAFILSTIFLRGIQPGAAGLPPETPLPLSSIQSIPLDEPVAKTGTNL